MRRDLSIRTLTRTEHRGEKSSLKYSADTFNPVTVWDDEYGSKIILGYAEFPKGESLPTAQIDDLIQFVRMVEETAADVSWKTGAFGRAALMDVRFQREAIIEQ